MPRLQFSLKTLLWLIAVVAALFGGRVIGIREEREGRINELVAEQIEARDEQVYLRNQVQKTLQQHQQALQEFKSLLDSQRQMSDMQRQITKETQKRLDKLVEQREAAIKELRGNVLTSDKSKIQTPSPKSRLLEETLDKVDSQRRGRRIAEEVARFSGTALASAINTALSNFAPGQSPGIDRRGLDDA
jgi:hypothetical protein